MNYSRRLNLTSKLFVSIFLFISIFLTFTACENFLQGEDVKEEITKTIEYNNAPSYTINVEALKGTGVIKTPATGEVEKKVTDVFPVRFEPEDSCKFIRWEAVISELGEGETPSDYIQFENAESLETKVTFKKATASGSVIVIRPVCPPRLTYTFEQDGGIIYPKDTSIEFNFNQALSAGCLAGTAEEEVKASNYVSIQELTGGVDASTYFNPPEITNKRLLFRSDTSFGYLPLINNQRMISVRIPKEQIWYVNEQYTTPVRVYLDSDISKTFIIGPETSKKTVINYKVRKNGEEDLGILKIDGDALDNKNHEYSVGQKISLRYQLPDNYSFIDWKFLDAEGNPFTEENLKLTYTKEAESENLQILNIVVDNYMEKVVTIVPEICDPVKIKIVKGSVGIDSFKIDKTAIAQEEQSFEYGVGKSFVLNCKMAEGFTFTKWKFSYDDAEIALDDPRLHITLSDADVSNGIAQLQITINEYMGGVISVAPVFCDPVKIKIVKGTVGIDNFKIDKTAIAQEEQSFEYGVGKSFALSCKMAEGFTFSKWKFLYDNVELALDDPRLHLTLSDADVSNGIAQLQITIKEYMSGVISVVPVVCYPVKIKFLKDAEGVAAYKTDAVALTQEEQTLEYGVEKSVNLSCKPQDGYSFFGWDYKRTYTNEKGEAVTEILTKDSLEELGIKVSFDEDTASTDGYDSSTRLAQAKITVLKYTDNIISIKPIIIQNLAVTAFNNSDAEKTYYRDSNIELTFNHSLLESSKDKLKIKIQGEDDSKVADYFETAVLAENKLTISAKKTKLIPLLADDTNTITLILPASDFSYEAQTPDGKKYNVGLTSDLTYTYKISSETREKTKIKVQLYVDKNDENKNNETETVGTLKVNNTGYLGDFDYSYSIGNTVSITYGLGTEEAANWKFKQWELSHTYTDAAGQPQTEKIVVNNVQKFDYLNLSVSSGGASGTAGLTIIINGTVDGSITVQPILEYIADVKIIIDGSHGKFTPEKGEKNYKLGQTYHIEYEPDSDFEFIRWRVMNGTEEFAKADIEKYIASGNLSEEKADFTFIAVPDIELELNPLIVERPQIISNAPAYDAKGVLSKTSIQVMFDHDMNEQSIYYTKPELTKLALQGFDELLSVTKDGEEKVYGYEKDNQIYFKNISIINSRNNKNILDKFEPPVFETPRTLTISVKDVLPAGLNVLVTLEKDFFHTIYGKDVSMSQAKKWLYLVNGKEDTSKPDITSIKVLDSAKNEITATSDITVSSSNVSSLNFFRKGEFYLALQVQDDQAPSTNFTINLKQIYDSSYNKLEPLPDIIYRTVDYSNYYGVYGIYGKETNETTEPDSCNISEVRKPSDKELADGVYGFSITVKDGSKNETTSPNDGKLYYFCLDSTAPAMSAPSVADGPEATSLVVSWDKTEAVDYKEAVIKWREWGSKEDYSTSVSIPGETYTIDGLKEGTRYEIVADYKDYAGNIQSVPVADGAYTRPAVPKSVELSTTYGTSVTLTGTNPDVGNCTNLRIRYKIYGSSDDWTEYPSRITESGSSQTITPAKGYKYIFEVCSYDARGEGKYSFPYYITGTTYPTFTAAPNAAVLGTPSSSVNSVTINWTKPAVGNCTGYIVYISPDSSFPNDKVTTQTKTNNTTTNATFTNLTAGSQYYYKVLTYYENQANTTATNYSSTLTKCATATNLKAVSESSSSMKVSWTAPAGNFVSYKLYYKKHSDSTYANSVSVSKGNTETIVSGLAGGTAYDFALHTIGEVAAQENSTTIASITTHPNVVQNLRAEKKTGSNTEYTLSWMAPASGEYDGYKYYIANSVAALSSATATTVAKDTTGTITLNKTAATNSLLYIKVSTYIGSLETESAPICCSLALDPVKSLTATATSTSAIKLSWTNPESSGYDGIRVHIGDKLIVATDGSPSISKTETSYEITKDLSANTNYSFTVTTYKKVTIEGVVTELKAENLVSKYTLATQVGSLRAEAESPTKVKLTWTNPSAWSQIFVYQDGSKIDYWNPAHNTTSATYTVGNGGTSYNFEIRGVNGNGIVNNANAKTVSITTPAQPVTNLKATRNTSYPEERIDLAWTKPAGKYTGIKIYSKLQSANDWRLEKTYEDNTSTSYTVWGLKAANKYDFKVESYLTGISNVGTTSVATTNGVTRPTKTRISLVESLRTNTQLGYSWNPDCNVDGYIFYWKKENQSTYNKRSLAATDKSTIVNGLSTGTVLNAYLECWYGSEDNKVASDVISNTTSLAAPTNLKVTTDNNGDLTVSWTAPSGATTAHTDYWLFSKKHSESDWDYSRIHYIDQNGTSFTFKNSTLVSDRGLAKGEYYDFKVRALNYVEPDSSSSPDSSIVSAYAPPGEMTFFNNNLPVIYHDDAMSTVTLRWINATGRTDVSGIKVFLGTTDKGTVFYSSGSGSTKSVTIPSYSRGSSYTFYLQPYHNKGGTYVYGPKKPVTLKTSSGNLIINGKEYSKTELKNVITSSSGVTLDKNGNGTFNSNRTITLTKYSIGAYEVTQSLFYAVMGYNPSNLNSSYSDSNIYPVNNITWYEAIAFCNKLSALQGLTPCYTVSGISDWANLQKSQIPTTSNSTWNQATLNQNANGYHLPTEAQYEFAARGGNPNDTVWDYKYAGSKDYGSYVWCTSNSKGTTHEVGSKSGNTLGLYDMCGNVYEWTSDWDNTFDSNKGTFTNPWCGYNTSKTSSTYVKDNSGKILLMGGSYDRGDSYCYIHPKDDYSKQPEGDSASNKKTWGMRICRNVTY